VAALGSSPDAAHGRRDARSGTFTASGRRSAQVCYPAPALLARPVPTALVAALLTALASACPAEPPPPSVEGTSGTDTAATEPPAATTFAGPDACQSSEDCETDGHCVAPYDPGSDPPMGQGGCIEACIEIDDLTRWCFDDESCCGNARCQEVDGLCEPGPAGTGSSTGEATGTSSGTDGSSSGGTTGGDTSTGGSSTGGSSSSSSGTSSGTR
jgi:hypothetical protein